MRTLPLHRAWASAAFALAAAIPLVSLHSAAQQAQPAAAESDLPGQAVHIGIDQFKFQPEHIQIAAGTTVTWVNHDGEPHTVTSIDQHFKSSGALDTDDHFSQTFTEPGTYSYICSVHPFMRGTVTVSAADRASSRVQSRQCADSFDVPRRDAAKPRAGRRVA